MLAQEARQTDGEADVQSHRKSKTSYLRTFGDADEIAEQWAMLTKPGDEEFSWLCYFSSSSLLSLEPIALLHPKTAN